MSQEASTTVAESAMRGIACKCPRCGKGKLYDGFLTLRARCESCGLDYAFIDAGDGAGDFHHHDCRVYRCGFSVDR